MKKPDEPLAPKVYSRAQAAKLLRITVSGVQNLEERGSLCRLPGPRVFYAAKNVESLFSLRDIAAIEVLKKTANRTSEEEALTEDRLHVLSLREQQRIDFELSRQEREASLKERLADLEERKLYREHQKARGDLINKETKEAIDFLNSLLKPLAERVITKLEKNLERNALSQPRHDA